MPYKHPNQGGSLDTRRRDSVDYVQRRVLLELVTSPPEGGDELDRLVLVLDWHAAVEAAVDALVDVGLAERDEHRVRATAAALRFDALWPAV